MSGDGNVVSDPQLWVTNQGDNPMDSVSSIVWNQNRQLQHAGFFVGAWDGFVRYYQIQGMGQKHLVKVWEYFYEHPVLSVDVTGEMVLVVGLGNGHIVLTNFINSAEWMVLGQHQAPICKVIWIERQQVLLSMGFDNCLKVWTLQQINNKHLQKEYKLPEKTYAVSCSYPHLLVGSYYSKCYVFDLENITNVQVPTEYIDVGLDRVSKIMCVALVAETKNFLVGLNDGRLLYGEYSFGTSLKFKQHYISKSQKDEDRKLLGQVSSVDIGAQKGESFGLAAGTFELQCLNLRKRKLPKVYRKVFASPVTAVKLHPSYQFCAFATGCDWIRGVQSLHQVKRPRICLAIFSKQEQNKFTS